MLVRVSLALFLAALIVAAAGTLRNVHVPANASEAEAVAFRWVGEGVAQRPRRDGDAWEVDVIRPDGSLVEVTIDDRLALQGFDEELGPKGRRAHDEIKGLLRKRAVHAALAATGFGRTLSVERESNGELEVVEVNIRRADRGDVEVGLDSTLGIVEIDAQDPGDE